MTGSQHQACDTQVSGAPHRDGTGLGGPHTGMLQVLGPHTQMGQVSGGGPTQGWGRYQEAPHTMGQVLGAPHRDGAGLRGSQEHPSKQGMMSVLKHRDICPGVTVAVDR